MDEFGGREKEGNLMENAREKLMGRNLFLTSFSFSRAIFVNLLHRSTPILKTLWLTLRYFPFPQPSEQGINRSNIYSYICTRVYK